jgi:uncharacterized hydrophobic protein (TIGR00271 family)
MRQIIANVPRGEGERALSLARERGGRNLLRLPAEGGQDEREAVFLHVPNDQLDALLGALENISDLRLTLLPQGVITLRPPASEAADQAVDVSPRSSTEVFLSGLQSVGSWKGFLGYAAAAGAVVWTGLYTNTIYLLVAAMLIAPFAGPAMNLALGTARGDKTLIGSSLMRYFGSLFTTALVAWVLSVVWEQQVPSELMIQASLVSSVAIILPLTAGAAGALHLCQSERNSLVTAAGAGILVAASLAPPAGVIGIGTAMQEWDMVKSSVYVLLLQLFGINLSGAVVFALFGLHPRGVRYDRGQSWVRWATWSGTAVVLGALLTWQFREAAELQRSSTAQRIAGVVKEALQQNTLVDPIEVQVRFTRANIPGQDSCLIVGYVQRTSKTKLEESALKRIVAREVAHVVTAQGFRVTPLVALTVLQEPDQAEPSARRQPQPAHP